MTTLTKLSFTQLSLYIDCVSFFSSWRYCQIVSQTGHNWKGGQLFNGLSFNHWLPIWPSIRLPAWRKGEKLCSLLSHDRCLFSFKHTHKHTQVHIQSIRTHTGRYWCICPRIWTNIPFHLKNAHVPITWYRSIEAKETPHTHTHQQTVCSPQADGICSRRLLFSTTLIWRSLAQGKH